MIGISVAGEVVGASPPHIEHGGSPRERGHSRLITATHWLLVLLSLLGMRARMVMVWRDVQAPAVISVDQRYMALRRALSREGARVVGYWSDLPDGDKAYMQAQYSLAPTVLRRATMGPVVVADLTGTASLEELCATRGLKVIERFADGVALLRATSVP